jgi:phosphate starvation-inducible PhoH-like protein
MEILKSVEGISFVHFDERDVVRHSLVQRIVRAYEKYNEVAAGRQLTLKLSDPFTPEADASSQLPTVIADPQLSDPAAPASAQV